MFILIPVIEHPIEYVVVGVFHHGEWYLRNASTESGYPLRIWTNNIVHAIRFNSEDMAETIALLVCHEDEFFVKSLSARYSKLS